MMNNKRFLFLTASRSDGLEPNFPPHVPVGGESFVVQLREYISPERIVCKYAYFSSYSSSAG